MKCQLKTFSPHHSCLQTHGHNTSCYKYTLPNFILSPDKIISTYFTLKSRLNENISHTFATVAMIHTKTRRRPKLFVSLVSDRKSFILICEMFIHVITLMLHVCNYGLLRITIFLVSISVLIC